MDKIHQELMITEFMYLTNINNDPDIAIIDRYYTNSYKYRYHNSSLRSLLVPLVMTKDDVWFQKRHACLLDSASISSEMSYKYMYIIKVYKVLTSYRVISKYIINTIRS